MKLLSPALLLLALSAPALAQQAPATREHLITPLSPADPPAVTLEAKPETPRSESKVMECKNDPEAEKAGNRDMTCTEVKNPKAKDRHPDYGKLKQYPLTPA